MGKFRRDTLLLLAFTGILAISAFLFFQYSFRLTAENPFYQGLVATLIGAIITAMITAVLLNRQTEVELRKEENIKFLDLKVTIYTQLLDLIENFILAETITDRDIIKLRIINQKISFVASVSVLEAFGEFSQTLAHIASDRNLISREIDELLRKLGRLSISIRFDLLESINTSIVIDRTEAIAQIIENTQFLEIRSQKDTQK
jgi:hypothetical protein